MHKFDLDCSGWDFDNLSGEQQVELHAYLHSFVIAPDDQKRRTAICYSFKSLITKQLAEPNIKNVNVELLRMATSSINKKDLTALEGTRRTTAYLCRMITHHDEELVRRSSLGKSQYLVEKWAVRQSKKGFSRETLRKNWATHKLYAPLVTATFFAINRLNKKMRNDNKHPNMVSKLQARLLGQIELAPTILCQALHIQNLLSGYNVTGGKPLLNPKSELLFDVEILPTTAKPIKWKRLTDTDLQLLKTEYKKDLAMKRP